MPDTVDTIRTTVRVEKALWRSAKICAMDQELELQELIAAAIKAYLAEIKRKGGRR